MGAGKLHYYPMIKETTTTTGNGFLVLDGAVPGFLTFSSRLSQDQWFHYMIIDPVNDEWECNVGYLNVSGNLIRWTANSTEQSSNGVGSILNLQAGTKYVALIDGQCLSGHLSLSPNLRAYTDLAECGINDVVAIGQRALAGTLDSIAIGTDALSNDLYCTAIGKDAHSTGWDSLAFGQASRATDDYAIAVGRDAEAIKDYAIAIGRNAEATEDRCIAIGRNSYSTGDNDCVAIGHDAHAIHPYSVSIGSETRTWSKAMINFSSGFRSQTGCILISGDTTNTTPLTLTTDNTGASAAPIIEYGSSADTKAVFIKATIFGHDQTNENVFVHEYTLAAYVDSGNTTADQIGTTTDTNILETGGMTAASATVTVNGTTGAIEATVTGLAATNIQWVGRLEFLANWQDGIYGGVAH